MMTSYYQGCSVTISALGSRSCARCLLTLTKLNTQGYQTLFSMVHRKSSSKPTDDQINLNPSTSASQRITSPVIDRNWLNDDYLDNKGRLRVQNRNNKLNTDRDMYRRGTGYQTDRRGTGYQTDRRGTGYQTDRRSTGYQTDHQYNQDNKKTPKMVGQVIYGRFPIQVALQARRRKFYKLFVKSSLLETYEDNSGHIINQIRVMAKDQNVKIEAVSQHLLNELVDDPVQGLRQHQGVCADVSPLHHIPFDADMERCQSENSRHRVWLVVQSVQDPNNFGAVMRSAYYLGVDKVITFNSCKLSPAVSKVSAGAIEVMDVYKTDDLHQLLQVCRQHNWQIFGTTGQTLSDGVIPLHKVEVNRDTLVLLGNEGEGLTEEICALCDHLITIPYAHHHTHAALDSLNVSVASGIILYQLMTRRASS